jgi:NAD(P)-dependent dehydrogenase (short-subunit alcohol dehydrogenase family)
MSEHPLPPGGTAVVIGASGAIGGALATLLQQDGRFAAVLGFSRPEIDICDEASVAAAAAQVNTASPEGVRLVVVATGLLHDEQQQPEKSWRHFDAAALTRSFRVNAVGPALIIKHFAPLLPREGRSALAFLSARAASLSENRIGGWYGYRASKAALNQLVRSAAAELARGRKEALCVALHPGHVESRLSAPFGAGGNPTFSAEAAAQNLLGVLDALPASESGGFFNHDGERIPY